ncbi:MAG: methionyl-tRNA formyltransferase [Erysipelotrichaceae bacterium]|nr:methionyl-tRNA formyltransferase [Erysipelotrichaceae bacterium]
MKVRVVFMGTPVFATAVLKSLIEEKYDVVAVVTQPDKPIGREQKMMLTPIKTLALSFDIPVLQPLKVKESVDEILAYRPDLIVTCAYGQMLPKRLLDTPRLGCINVHASLLPKYRGGAPIHKAVMDGELKTGISLMKMAVKMDAGPIFAQREVDIGLDDTTEVVHDCLMDCASFCIREDLPLVVDVKAIFVEQDESKVTFAYNIASHDEKIDFDKGGRMIYNQIRGLISWPVAHFIMEGKKCKIHQAHFVEGEHRYTVPTFTEYKDNAIILAVNDGWLHIKQLQLEGKKKSLSADFYNGIGKTWIGKEVDV